MARNLATGKGFAFNPGEPVAESTGPLYTFILAFFYALFHEVVWSAKISASSARSVRASLFTSQR
jgi:hypothetical protein